MKYERLTTHSAKGLKFKKGKKFVELLSDKNLTLSALNHLAELEDKIESGQLVELPRILQWFADPKLCQVLYSEDGHIRLTETITKAQAETRLKELQERL